jgi:hypothetical protein
LQYASGASQAGIDEVPDGRLAAEMKILSFEIEADRLLLRTDDGLVAVEPRTARTVRIRCTLESTLSRKPSLVVTTGAIGSPVVPFDVVERLTDLVFSTSALTIEID